MNRRHSESIPTLSRAAVAAGALGFVWATTHWYSWQQTINLLFGSDMQEYERVARAAPGLPRVALPSQHADRFVPHYVIGLLADLLGVGDRSVYYAASFLLLGAIVFAVDRAIAPLRLRLGAYALCLSALVFNPYLFRFLAVAPARLADSVFVIGTLVALIGFLRANSLLLVGGLIAAVLGRSEALLPLVVLAPIGVLHSPGWRSRTKAARTGVAAASLVAPLAVYAVVRVVDAGFSVSDHPGFMGLTLVGTLVALPGSAGALGMHLARSLVGLAAVAGLLLGVVAAGVRAGRRLGEVPFGAWASFAAGLAVSLEAIALNPTWLAGSEPLLSALGAAFFVVAAAILLDAWGSHASPIGWGTIGLSLFAFALTSLHHVYASVSPARSAGEFAALAVAGLVLAGLVLSLRLPLLTPGGRSTQVPLPREFVVRGAQLRRRLGRTWAAEFALWTTLALALAALAGFDALSSLLRDHNNIGDGNHAVMAVTWLVLAAWAGARGLDAVPARRRGVRRRWFVTLLLLAALPYAAIVETDLAYLLNVICVAAAGQLALMRADAPPAAHALRVVQRLLAGTRPAPTSSPERGERSSQRRARRTFFTTAASFTPFVAVEAKGELFIVSTADKELGGALFAKRSRNDIPNLRTAVLLLEQRGIRCAGTTFVDVGANIGTTTITALRRYGFAHGVALEPAPRNAHLLRLNLAVNGLASVVSVHEVAATNREGELRLVLSRRSSGLHRVLATSGAIPAADDAVTVRAVTLDGLVARGVIDPAEVGLLWIDAQRHEPHVLAGASSLLVAGVPLVMALRPRRYVTNSEAMAAFAATLAAYTDFAELRRMRRFTNDLPGLLHSLPARPTDLIAVRDLT